MTAKASLKALLEGVKKDYSAEDAFRIAEALFAKLPGVVGWG